MPTQPAHYTPEQLAGIPIPKVLDMDRLPACCPLDEGRVAALAHEAARLGYDTVKVKCGGATVFITATFSAALEASRLQRQHGLILAPMLPLRLGIPTRLADTAQP